MPNIRIETVELDSGGRRQIRSRDRATELLQERSDDIEVAINQAASILSSSASKLPAHDGWQISSLEATFGIVLSAEAGAILTKASAEASLEVTVTIERSE